MINFPQKHCSVSAVAEPSWSVNGGVLAQDIEHQNLTYIWSDVKDYKPLCTTNMTDQDEGVCSIGGEFDDSTITEASVRPLLSSIWKCLNDSVDDLDYQHFPVSCEPRGSSLVENWSEITGMEPERAHFDCFDCESHIKL
ncbi:unnamed protein product [Soboliphyme baturini]|uniref:Ovule protein n=1 Tax=Soboliphyme baturini TaxID=241478 RepID=A0A183J7I6_9BILA|nr:unnamed protein product [Soboliphyme baturini]